jgi:hypothetical protein
MTYINIIEINYRFVSIDLPLEDISRAAKFCFFPTAPKLKI